MKSLGFIAITVCVASVMMAYQLVAVEAQIFDRLMNNNNQAANQAVGSLDGNQNNRQMAEIGPVFKRMMNNMMSVNVPVFYDMVKNGTSMGINVLSGLVRVDRGREAERSGLQGPRPLSVRVFGVPVYERGHRVRNPPMTSNDDDDDDTTMIDNDKPEVERPKGEGNDEEELPIEP